MDVMFYGKYLRFMEIAETAYFRALGYTYDSITERFGIWLPRVHLSLDFRASARVDDTLTTWAEVTKIGGSSVHFAFPIERDGERLADGKLILAALDRTTMRAIRLPDELRAAFES
jgi:YbgC/YbaW family acyl-CoA thioester hydrolase